MNVLQWLAWFAIYFTGAGVLAWGIGRALADPRPRCVTCARRIDTDALTPGDAFAVVRTQRTYGITFCPPHARSLLSYDERTTR